ncbi:MAG: adenylate/guanylate cyclase domain-containing protein, partial [Spirochaetia bacterium]
ENLTDAQKPALFDGFIHNQQDSEKEVELFHQWKHLLPENEEVPRKIAEFLASSPENLLQRIRPFELVEQYGLPKLDVLRFFLLASKEGFFQANWDLICPSCMGAKTTVSSLQEFKNEAHCDYCNINYTVNYSDNLELTFTPTEKARPVSKSVFCFGGPYNSSHVIAQVNVEPDQNRTLELNLEPGMYRVRSVTMDNEYKFEALSGRKPEKQHIELTAEFYNENGRSASTDLELSFHNTKEYTQTVKLERTKWRENVVTADYITSLQDFRDLFDAEVLKPGIRISISNLVIMFTDLKNSTYLYDTYGDSKAFSLVNDHFDAITQLVRENNGGVVKTIGDAVMAAFTVPRDAFRTALEIQEKFGTPVTDTPKFSDFVIKLGIHQGPCIILNLNDNLDYFGSSVNKAARVQGESKGDDIVISDTLYNNEDVKKLIREYRLESETFTKPLKGITETAELFRLTFPKEG